MTGQPIVRVTDLPVPELPELDLTRPHVRGEGLPLNQLPEAVRIFLVARGGSEEIADTNVTVDWHVSATDFALVVRFDD